MNLNEILEQNREFNVWKNKMDVQIKMRHDEIKELNNRISEEKFKKLTYDEAKEFYGNIKYNLDYHKDKEKQTKKWLQELKIKEYPILTKAHYYPIINEMDFLTDKQKHELDKALYDFRSGYVMTGSRLWHRLNFHKETEEKIFNFLYGKGTVKKYYEIMCPDEYSERCQCVCERISEDIYNMNKKYYNLIANIESYESYQESIELYESGQIINELCCMDCDSYIEIESFDDIKNQTIRVTYKNVTKPDMTYANK